MKKLLFNLVYIICYLLVYKEFRATAANSEANNIITFIWWFIGFPCFSASHYLFHKKGNAFIWIIILISFIMMIPVTIEMKIVYYNTYLDNLASIMLSVFILNMLSIILYYFKFNKEKTFESKKSQ